MKNKTPKKRRTYKGGGEESYTITYQIGNQVSPIDGMGSTGTIGQLKNKKSTAGNEDEAIRKVKDKLKSMGTCPDLTAKLNYHVTCRNGDTSSDTSDTRYAVNKSFFGGRRKRMRMKSRKRKNVML